MQEGSRRSPGLAASHGAGCSNWPSNENVLPPLVMAQQLLESLGLISTICSSPSRSRNPSSILMGTSDALTRAKWNPCSLTEINVPEGIEAIPCVSEAMPVNFAFDPSPDWKRPFPYAPRIFPPGSSAKKWSSSSTPQARDALLLQFRPPFPGEARIRFPRHRPESCRCGS